MHTSRSVVAFGMPVWPLGLVLAVTAFAGGRLVPQVWFSDLSYVVCFAVTVIGIFLALVGTGRRPVQLVPIVLTSIVVLLSGSLAVSAGQDINRFTGLIAQRTAEYETSRVQLPRVLAKWARSSDPFVRAEVARRKDSAMATLHLDHQNAIRDLRGRRTEAAWALGVFAAITLALLLGLAAFTQVFRRSRRA